MPDFDMRESSWIGGSIIDMAVCDTGNRVPELTLLPESESASIAGMAELADAADSKSSKTQSNTQLSY